MEGTGKIDVEIHSKKRMPSAQVADFPMIFHVRARWRKSSRQGVFGCRLFGRTRFPEIVGTLR